MKNKDENAACVAVFAYFIAYSVSLYIGSILLLAISTAYFILALYTSWSKGRLEKRLKRYKKSASSAAREALQESEDGEEDT